MPLLTFVQVIEHKLCSHCEKNIKNYSGGVAELAKALFSSLRTAVQILMRENFVVNL
jgi:hypothetical protein